MPSQKVFDFSWTLSLLLAAALATYLLGNNSVLLWDRDEPRYAQTSKQMLDSGDWVVPRLLDEVREKKPAFIYWCQASAMRIFGENTFAARFPSSVFVAATVWLLACATRRECGNEIALWSAFILASSVMVIAAAKMAITDGVLLLFATAAQLFLYRLLNGDRRWRIFVVFGVAQGFALLTKGPVVPAVSAMTVLTLLAMRWLDRKNRALTPRISTDFPKLVVAALIALAIFSPWWFAMEHARPGWTWRALHNEVLNRAAAAQEGHKGPPGYYLATIWGTFLPWSLLLPVALVGGWQKRFDPKTRFAMAAAIGPWILFELSATKLVHYLLPVYPALAFLVAQALVDRPKWRKPLFIAGAATFVSVPVIYAGILPRIPELRLSKRLAEAVRDIGATRAGDALMIDYKETSLAFYQGGTIRPQSENLYLVNAPFEQWPTCIVMTEAIWKRMPVEVQNRLELVRRVHGLNYAGKDADGRYLIDVLVLRKR